MRFTPRILSQNVNISKISPLRELFVLLGGILGVILSIYLILGWSLDYLIARMPTRLEQTAAELLNKTYRFEKQQTPVEAKVQKILDDLVQYFPEKERKFTVHILQQEEINALALPGGHILLFSGLLKEIQSENELAMVLGHELGHFSYRDHLRGLGRGLVLAFISSTILGVDNMLSGFMQNALSTAELKFSRSQELAADSFALELLNAKYGHVAASYDFFMHLEGKHDLPRCCRFLSTHPDPSDRINFIKEQIKQKGYQVGEATWLQF